MKKTVITFVLLLVGFNAISQESQEEKIKKNEIKINAAYLIAGIPEIGYSYLINEESSVGVDLFLSIAADSQLRFALTPNYRFFFGNEYASGFFVEGFASLNTTEVEDYDTYEYTDETDFALGFSIGGKFITNNKFTFEIYGGVGRNLFNTKSEEIIPRAGITIGKRF